MHICIIQFRASVANHTVFLTQVNCQGYEDNLIQCSHKFGDNVCTYNQDVLLSCGKFEWIRYKLCLYKVELLYKYSNRTHTSICLMQQSVIAVFLKQNARCKWVILVTKPLVTVKCSRKISTSFNFVRNVWCGCIHMCIVYRWLFESSGCPVVVENTIPYSLA